MFPGEEIIVPSVEAIQKLRRTKKLSEVNKFISQQEKWIAHADNVSGVDAPADFTKEESIGQLESNLGSQTELEHPSAGIQASEPEKVNKADGFKYRLIFILLFASLLLLIPILAFLSMRRKSKKKPDIAKRNEKSLAKRSKEPISPVLAKKDSAQIFAS